METIEKKILLLVDEDRALLLANLLRCFGLCVFTKEEWGEAGNPYLDNFGNEFFHYIVQDRGEPMESYSMAFPNAENFYFNGNIFALENQLSNILCQS